MSKICVHFDAPPKIIKLCSASRMTFRAWFYRTDPQNIGGQFGTSFGLFEKHFSKANEPKQSPKIFRTEKFQVYFWETNTSLFLGGSAFRLGKSVYYLFPHVTRYISLLSLAGKTVTQMIINWPSRKSRSHCQANWLTFTETLFSVLKILKDFVFTY